MRWSCRISTWPSAARACSVVSRARRAGELGVESADGEVGAVEVGAHGGAPFEGINGDRRTELALEAGAGDEAVQVRPRGGDGGGGLFDLGPVGDIAAGETEGGMAGGEVGLVRAGEAPDLVAASQEMFDQGPADAGAGAGDEKIQGRHGMGP